MSTQPPVAVEKVQAGQIVRQDFGSTQLQRSGETAASAVAAQAAAMIQARYVMAMQRPRDMDQVRVKIMKEIERPGFAEAAWYRKPIGQGVEGLTVRFAEAAARCLGNISHDAAVIYEDQTQRIIRLTVADIESNTPYSKDIVVTKTVERRSLKAGQVAISSRTNSVGQITHLVEATDDEILAKENSLLSKQFRNFVEKILPGDIKDAAKERIKAIRAGDAAKDPEAAKRKVADAFAGIGVMPAQLKAYLGHELDQCSPAEISELRDVYAAINTGEATWSEVMEGRTGDAGTGSAKAGLEGLKDKLRAEVAKPGIVASAPVVGLSTDSKPLTSAEMGVDPDAADAEKEPAHVVPVGKLDDGSPCGHEPMRGWPVPKGKQVMCSACRTMLDQRDIAALGAV